ncbi:hypothetical protein H5410_041274 [Solanum commersonii]|uniref:Uncharacterized protein n=1 Tax=Solanum commersonii TaxID=4109 RepID=A0A9J5XUB2_SOLCO|nr:hypothetical protein H5410_041274 [Solanum commersonii]
MYGLSRQRRVGMQSRGQPLIKHLWGLKGAQSLDGGKTDNISEIFCAWNYNKYGRYISLISIMGSRRYSSSQN